MLQILWIQLEEEKKEGKRTITVSLLGTEEDEGFLTKMSVKLPSLGGEVSNGVDCNQQF